MDKSNKGLNANNRVLMDRITKIRASLIEEFPFYGNLLFYLKISFANCGTACTDMEKIIYDPNWISTLGDEELKFLTMHELMHCVLEHPARGKNKLNYRYNIAADIVVNSHILWELNLSMDFKMDGEIPMHLSPDGMEGRFQTAEEVYQKLLSSDLSDRAEDEGSGDIHLIDRHDIWKKIGASDPVISEWRNHIKETLETMESRYMVPSLIRNMDFDASRGSIIDWRGVLKNFLQKNFEEFDYSFMNPDRRYSSETFILPGIHMTESEQMTRNIWVFIDTSASMSDDAVMTAYSEIRYLIEQIEGVKGWLSFFDWSVTELVPFETVDDLLKIKPVGNGGTSFHAVFDYAKKYDQSLEENNYYTFNEDNGKPGAIIIITDGYADLPKEEKVELDTKVLWLLVETDIKKMDWGESVWIGK